MEPAAVNYRGKLRQLTVAETSNLFFFDKKHKLSLLIFIDFECFNHYFGKQLQYYTYTYIS